MSSVAVILINPKSPYNVGAAIRACSIFDVKTLRWTGKRIGFAEAARMSKQRWPREERMKDYANVDWREASEHVITSLRGTPVAIECLDNSEPLHTFEHPEDAVYVFGAEDGTLGRSILTVCHRFVRIPTIHRPPLNLAAAVNIVLYDRHAKTLRHC